MPQSRLPATALLLLLGALGCKNKSEEYCRHAREEYNQTVQATSSGTEGSQPIPAEPFMTQCKAMPEEVAHCAMLSYRVGHEIECRPHEGRLRALAAATQH